MKHTAYLIVGWMLLALLTTCKHPSVEPDDQIAYPTDQHQLPSEPFIVTASMDKGLKVALTWAAQTGNPTYQILRTAASDITTDPYSAKYEKG